MSIFNGSGVPPWTQWQGGVGGAAGSLGGGGAAGGPNLGTPIPTLHELLGSLQEQVTEMLAYLQFVGEHHPCVLQDYRKFVEVKRMVLASAEGEPTSP